MAAKKTPTKTAFLTNSEVLDHLAYCVAEVIRDPRVQRDEGYARGVAEAYFRRYPELAPGFDCFLVRMDDALAYQAGSPVSRWTERVTRMAALERERRAAKPGPGTRCVLCRCDSVSEKFGFPVCEYHQTHGEDDPACQECA